MKENISAQIRNYKRSLTAYLLAAVLILSLVMVPAKVYGADLTYVVKRDYSYGVTATVSNKDTPSNDWSEIELRLENTTADSICDWIVALRVPAGTADSFKCWNATFTTDGDTIYLFPMQSGDNAVIGAGEPLSAYVPGGGFAGKYVDAGSIKVKTVYFNKGTASTLDYSSGETNDDNGGGGGGSDLKDTTTDLDLDIEYNYARLFQDTLYFYDANMCGREVGETSAFSWRDDCHTADENVSYTSPQGNTYSVDVSGGFHDAGDHVKFGLPQGYAATVLALEYYCFGKAYDELGQTSHYNKILDYFCDYFTRCTVYNKSDKAVEAFCYQVGDGDADHAQWIAPEKQTGSRPAFFADSNNPATDEVSVAIAALALHGYNSGNDSYIKTAEDLFRFAKKCVDAGTPGCATLGAGTFYKSSDWKDDYSSAAAALYKATGKSIYKTELSTYYTSGNIKTGWVLGWDNTWAVAAVLNEDWPTVKTFASYGDKNTAQGFKFVDGWGSARYNTTIQMLGLAYDQANGTDSFTTWATGQMKYLLGNNKNKRCFIVGYNENSSKYPHHRAASNSTDASLVSANHYTLLGALVGGPSDTNDTYADNQGDYNCNEVALDYNAGIVGAAAGLYLAHKTDKDAINTLESADRLTKLGIVKNYGTAGGTTEASTETTEASTEVTEASTETTEASTEVTEASTETTEASTEVTEASTETTEASTEVTEASTETTEASTETTEASTETTEEEVPVVGEICLDVSRITGADCEYVKSLPKRLVNGVVQPIVDVSVVDGEILVKVNTGNYEIVGANPKVKIIVDDTSSIMLNNAQIGAFDIKGSAELRLNGSCSVTGGIAMAEDAVLVIDSVSDKKTGSLEVSKKASAAVAGGGTLVVKGGTLKVTQTTEGSDGIAVNLLKMEKGALDVTVKDGNGVVVREAYLNGGKVNISSSKPALTGDKVSVKGADVTLQVTSPDEAVVQAKDSLVLASGTIATSKPENSEASDFEVGEKGTIMLGKDMNVKGGATYSKNPVDEDGKEIQPEDWIKLLPVGEVFADSQMLYKVTKRGTSDNSSYGKVTCVGYTGDDNTVTIPRNVEYRGILYSVTKLSRTAFAGKRTLTAVTVEKSITEIPSKAFKGCSRLKTVQFKGEVKKIGSSAFKGCSSKLAIKTPKKTGYKYCWYLKSNKKTQVNKVGVGANGNKALIGKWTPNKYTVKFSGNGATSGKMSPLKKCKYGTAYTLKRNGFKKEGYRFAGWNTKKNGKGKFCKDKGKIKNLSAKDGTTVTLYAQWKK